MFCDFLTLEERALAAEFNYAGVLIVSGALLADSLIGSVQEEILKNRGTTSCEMVMYSHIMGGVYVLVLAVGTGQLEQGITKYAPKPRPYTLHLGLWTLNPKP